VDYVQALSKTLLFKEMPQAELQKLAKVAVEQKLPAHTTLFEDGTPGDELFVIILGSVKVLKDDKSGEAEEVATLGTGSYFGEMALVADDHKRTATIETQELTLLLAFKQEPLLALCAKDDKFAHAFYKCLARGLERRLRSATIDAAYYRSVARHHH
jgi:CRP-like cAMP-binding protein